MCKSKVSICTLPDSLSLKVVWGMLYSFADFLTGILFSTHLSVHHGCRPFWGSEICSGAEFVEVLSQKNGQETHTKKTS